MKFTTSFGVEFEIPDHWWNFAEMNDFSRGDRTAYSYYSAPEIQEIPIATIKPPSRSPDIALFQKHRLVPILFAFQSLAALPAIEIQELHNHADYEFKVYHGCHRYYASVAAGFTSLPARILPANF
jgi:hypothetical protein